MAAKRPYHRNVSCNFMKKSIIILATIVLSLNIASGQNRKDSLLVFIGEKIEVMYSPCERLIDTIIIDKDTSYRYSPIPDHRYIAK